MTEDGLKNSYQSYFSHEVKNKEQLLKCDTALLFSRCGVCVQVTCFDIRNIIINIFDSNFDGMKVLGNCQCKISYRFGVWQGKGLLCL